MTPRQWTMADLRRIEQRWHRETLTEIAADLGVPVGTMKGLMHRNGIRCPAPNGKGRRRRFGPVTREHRNERRKWYRMYHRLRMDGVEAHSAAAKLAKQGCPLNQKQLCKGWGVYRDALRCEDDR